MKFKKNIIYLILSIFSTSVVVGQTTKRVDYFDIKEVRLLPSPFKNAQDVDLNYLLAMDADRLLTPFLRESNLPTNKPSYGNWENTGLDGHIGGHYISALAYMYAATSDQRIKERLDYMLSTLEKCQKANGDGYIGGVPDGRKIWDEIKNGHIKASGFSLNEKWVPLYNIHKTYAGLRDAYLLTGSEAAKSMLIKMTDWAILLVGQLSETQIQNMLISEHGGLNETFADVAAITQNSKYLDLARKFSQHAILYPLIQHSDSLTGLHANTQIPKVLGFKRIADIDHDEKWADAASYFWDNVVQQRTISIGGNSVSEHFNPTNDFSKMMHSIEGPETCNTYNMLRLTKMLYQTTPGGKYLDYYERSLYNHILSSQHPEHGGFVYFTQIRPAHYRVYSQPHTSMWCCVGSGMENHAKYGEMIYASKEDSLYVNLFIPSKLRWNKKNIEIIQKNTFPEQANTAITINTEKPTSFVLHIRKPGWLVAEPEVEINGEKIAISLSSKDYITINRTWEKGDVVTITLPMDLRVEQLPDNSNFYSFVYGPVVLAARSGTEDLKGLQADDSRMGHIAKGKQIPMANIPLLTGDPHLLTQLASPIKSKPLHFKLTSLYRGDNNIQMELEPFYGIHDARYIIYWPQATENQRIVIHEQIAENEREELLLNSITVDKVVCGEQQPESDHFMRERQSITGLNGDVRWRQTKSWFSYQMKKERAKVAELYIKFINESDPQESVVTIDGIPLGKIKSTASSGVQSITFKWPNNLELKETYEVKIQAAPDKSSHKILEVRTLDREANYDKI